MSNTRVVDGPIGVVGAGYISRLFAQVPAHQWAIFAACEKPIKDWFAAGFKAQTKAALAGNVPPGMKLVQTQTKRAWLDDGRAREFVVTRFGVDALEAPSPSQVEKLGATKEEIDGLITRPEGGQRSRSRTIGARRGNASRSRRCSDR